MEYSELEQLWKKYDAKLDKLETLNKKLLKETLLRKPERKLRWHKFQSMYGVISLPLIIAIALHPNFTGDNAGWKLYTGITITLLVVGYIMFLNYKGYAVLRSINLGADTVLDAMQKVVKYKQLFHSRWKQAFVYYPVICLGVLLITWNNMQFSPRNIAFLIGLFVVTYAMNIIGPRSYRNRIERLAKDIRNLDEYIG